jgi:hypothetical protein
MPRPVYPIAHSVCKMLRLTVARQTQSHFDEYISRSLATKANESGDHARRRSFHEGGFAEVDGFEFL